MIGQCFHVIIDKNVVVACLQNTSRLTMCQRRIFAKFASGQLLAGCNISFSQPPAGCKFHSVSRHPDGNFIQSALVGCKLHPASGHAIQNIQFACGQRTTKRNLNPAGGQPNANFAEISGQNIVKLLVFCKHAGRTFFKIKT